MLHQNGKEKLPRMTQRGNNSIRMISIWDAYFSCLCSEYYFKYAFCNDCTINYRQMTEKLNHKALCLYE